MAASAVIAVAAQPSAPVAHAATETNPSFYLNPNDLDFILKQIQIAEAHAAGGDLLCAERTDRSGKCVPDPKLPFGLRTVDGSFNNLLDGRSQWGAADVPFPRMLDTEWRQADPAPDVPQAPPAGNTDVCVAAPAGEPQPTCYAQWEPGHFVYDAEPRLVSNLIVDQTVTNPAAINAAENTPGGEVRADGTISIPNVTPDEGLSAPTNAWFSFFGQFFDHGLDLVNKGGNGQLIVPLQPDDPLYVDGSPTNFLTLTRATRLPGADGVVGTADDEHNNQTTPFVDQNQTYTSHPSHHFFLREYELVDGVPHDTGRLLDGTRPDGSRAGLATWNDIKNQAREVLGINLTDADVLNVPQIAMDPYGNFIPGESGFPVVVTPPGQPNLEGNLGEPVDLSNALRTNHAFLDDIAHGATPIIGPDGELQSMFQEGNDGYPVLDPETGDPVPVDGVLTGYDNVTLGEHFITGDGRGNENIGLTAVHHVFHSEHNRLVQHIKDVLAENPELERAYRGQSHNWSNASNQERVPRPYDLLPGYGQPEDWSGEEDDWSFEQRLFQAARFANEMQYQHLVFEEFARTIQPAIEPVVFNENSYDGDVDPSIVAEFAHVVYRFGHSMMKETIDRSGFGTEPVPLLDGFLNPRAYDLNGTLTPEQAAGSIVNGTVRQVHNEIDEFVIDTLRNELLGLPLDLATINLLRGRDTGTPGIQAARRTFYEATGDVSLRPYESWVDFGNNLKNGNVFGRGGDNASLVNFVAAYGTHPTILAAETINEKRAAAALLVNGAPPGLEFIARLAGTNRFETAAAISQSFFQPGVPVVYITNGMNYPDALAGGPTAAQLGGPILLASPTQLPRVTRQELVRLNPGRIVILGGPGAIGAAVETDLREYTTGTVTRLAGSDRYQTAVAISQATHTFSVGGRYVDRVYIASGANFPDALTGAAAAFPASTAAARQGAPVLLVRPGGAPQITLDELARLNPEQIIVLGGPGAVSDAVLDQLAPYGDVVRVAGNNRYRTAVALSEVTYPGGATTAYVATGELFPDALSAAPVAGINAAPLLLTPKEGPLPPEVRAELERLGVTKIIILGGPGAVSEAVQNELAELAPTDFGAPDDRLAFMNSTPGTEWANTEDGRSTTGIENVDFWIAGLAERVNPFGGLLGSTFNFVFEKQLENLQFGDRLYYLFRNQGNQLFAALEANSFSSLIERNTDATKVPANVFQTNEMVFDLNDLSNAPAGLSQRNDGTYYFLGIEHIEMYGTPDDDRMEGDQGDDFLVGGDGVDRIAVGSGNDTIIGGLGNDILTDQFGDDVIKGGLGNDAINGGPGLDLLFGGAGDDFIVKGGDSISSTFLGDGDDVFLGGPGRVNIFGGEGHDWLEGGTHADLVQGDNADQFQSDVIGGNDILLGRGGDDDFDAEGGDDILVAQRFGTDRHLGNMGWDWVTYYGETEGVNADFRNTILQRPDVTTISDRFDQVEALGGGAGNDVLRGISVNPDGITNEFPHLHKMTNSTLDMVAGLRELLQPENHDNYAERFMADGTVVDSDGVNNLIIGGPGSDTIEGRAGNDFLDGDAYLAAQLALVEPGTENIVEVQDSAAAYQARVFAGTLDPGDLRLVREIRFDDPGSGALDTVEYNDAYQAYTISWLGNGYWRVTHSQVQEAEESDGADVIRGFEVIQFNDTCALLDNVNGTFELCQEIGTVALTYPSATPVEDEPITATVLDNDGQPFDLSTAEAITFNWWVGEGTGPDAVTEWELLATTQPDDPTVPHVSTWAPDDAAADMYVRAIVNFRDANGITHVIPSAVTPDPVLNVNDLPVGPNVEVVGGAPVVGVNVNVFPPTDGDGIEGAAETGLVYRYEVSASPTFDAATPIEVRQESNQMAYTLKAEDVGLYLRVVVEYTDDLGAAETAVSAIVGPVTAAG